MRALIPAVVGALAVVLYRLAPRSAPVETPASQPASQPALQITVDPAGAMPDVIKMPETGQAMFVIRDHETGELAGKVARFDGFERFGESNDVVGYARYRGKRVPVNKLDWVRLEPGWKDDLGTLAYLYGLVRCDDASEHYKGYSASLN